MFRSFPKGLYESELFSQEKLVETSRSTVVLGFLRQLSEWRIFGNPSGIDSSNRHLEQNQRSQSQVTPQPEACHEMLCFWHTRLYCFNTLSLSVMVQESNSMSLADRGDVEKNSFCWQQKVSVKSSASKLLCLWFNHWIIPTWLLLMVIASSSGRWNSVGLRRFAQGGR